MPNAPFYVHDNKGNLVPAQFLTNGGNNVDDPNKANAQSIHLYTLSNVEINNANPNGWVVAPFGYSLDRAKAFGEAVYSQLMSPDAVGTLSAFSMMFFAFMRSGPEDLQRSYTDINGNTIPDGRVIAFQDIASIHFGAAAAAASISKAEALAYAGIYNSNLSTGTITTGEAGNNPLNANSIPFGWDLMNGSLVTTPTNTVLMLAIEPTQVTNVLGHPFDGTMAGAIQITDAIANGQIQFSGSFVDKLTNERYKASFDSSPEKIVVSADGSGLAVSTVSAGLLQHITSFPANGMQIDQAFAPSGIFIEKKTDLADQFDWDREIETFIDNSPVDKIVVGNNGTVTSASWNGGQVAGDIGAQLGSSLGRMLGGNSLVGQLSTGTVIGAIGKEVGNALFSSASFSLDTVVNHAFGSLEPGGAVGGRDRGGVLAADVRTRRCAADLNACPTCRLQ